MNRTRACIACTSSKRRCDREAPSCRRCADKFIRCEYPRSSHQRQHKSNPSAGIWRRHDGWIKRLEFDRVTPDDALSLSPPSWTPPSRLVEDKVSTWFHNVGSWAIDICPTDGPANFASDLSKHYIAGIRMWLHDWARHTHCPFIHGRLFQRDRLPTCLQDAYATLGCYLAKTSDNEDTVLQIVESRTQSLLLQQSIDESALALASMDTKHHLARVQALFIYIFIGLFDGNIRQRSLADAQISNLLHWCDSLWESATLDASTKALEPMLDPDNVEEPKEETASVAWPDWVLSESVRRTWLVAKYTITIYFAMRDGKTVCPGAVLFTSRNRLWNSTTSAEWSKELRQRDCLVSNCHEADTLMQGEAAWEVDDFGKHMFTILWGVDRIRRWVSDTREE
ncbi:hypothetical protein FDECE_10250 [Fusarium decemcellulare]|nr:hypothetical protein FDECE_10250 [Fusarium decemcellulare]